MSSWTVIRIVVYTSGRIYSGFEEQIGKRMEKKEYLGSLMRKQRQDCYWGEM